MSAPAYTRFMIIGKMRSGTTYVQSLLASHPQLQSYGEVLNLIGHHQNQRDDLIREIVLDPIAYLSNRIFKDYPHHIRAVGFKTVYEQVGAENAFLYEMETANTSPRTRQQRQQLWQFMSATFDLPQIRRRFGEFLERLARDTQLKVIHVKRRNKLATLLSERSAVLSGAWNSAMGAYEPGPIPLDVDVCTGFFEQTEAAEKRFDVLFQHHATIEIIYEQLLADLARTSEALQSFLGVDSHPLTARVERQRQLRLSESIANYVELKDAFQHSRWSEYFQAEPAGRVGE